MKIYNVYYQEEYIWREDSKDPILVGTVDNEEDAKKLAIYKSDLSGEAWVEEIEVNSPEVQNMIKEVDKSIEKNNGLTYWFVKITINRYERHNRGDYTRSWAETDAGRYPRIDACYPFFVKDLVNHQVDIHEDLGETEEMFHGIYEKQWFINYMLNGRVYCEHGDARRNDVFEIILLARDKTDAQKRGMIFSKKVIENMRKEEESTCSNKSMTAS